jgi:hypothetical protein
MILSPSSNPDIEMLQREIIGLSPVRGNPADLLAQAAKLSWENPLRVWWIKGMVSPSRENVESFMDSVEAVFKIHESNGIYKSAWWYAPDDGFAFSLKGIFTDLNPETGPGFYRRSLDGPKIAFWFGKIQSRLMVGAS